MRIKKLQKYRSDKFFAEETRRQNDRRTRLKDVESLPVISTVFPSRIAIDTIFFLFSFFNASIERNASTFNRGNDKKITQSIGSEKCAIS